MTQYNLLTVNGITKICSNNIYNYNDNILPVQWYDFQLKWLLVKLEIVPEEPGTNFSFKYKHIPKYLDIPNDIIFDLLKQTYGSTEETTKYTQVVIPIALFNDVKKKNSEEYKSNGFYNKGVDSGEAEDISFSQAISEQGYFGGFPNFTELKLSANRYFIEHGGEETFSTEGDSDEFPFFKGANDLLPKEWAVEGEGESGGGESGGGESGVGQSGGGEIETATDWINAQDEARTGFFIDKNNSSYADSIIFLILKSFHTRTKGLLYNNIVSPASDRTSAEFRGDESGKTSARSPDDVYIKTVFCKLHDMYTLIEEKKAIHIDQLINAMDICTEEKLMVGDGPCRDVDDPIKLLSELFKVISNNNLTEESRYEVRKKRYNEVMANVSGLNRILSYDVRAFIDHIDDFTISKSESGGTVQSIINTTSLINNKLKDYLIQSELRNKMYERIPDQVTKSEYIFNMYGLIIHTDFEKTFRDRIEQNGIPITNFLGNIDVFKTYEDKIEIRQYNISSKAEDIFIMFDRTSGGRNNRVKIIPEEIIEIQGSEYSLNGIVYLHEHGHYESILKGNEGYYKYNSTGKDEWTDYLGNVKINSLSDVCTRSCIHHYIRN